MADIFTMGIDIGSTASKCLVLKNGTEIVSKVVIPVGTGTSGPSRAYTGALEAASLSEDAISVKVATGYGRNTFEAADFRVSELSCHAIGAVTSCPGVRTVIDIGGQDAKALSIAENGTLENFIMNDKCAAGTGRFIEVMARVLELDVSELGERDSLSVTPAKISSTCTVFAESEVISQLSSGAPINDIVAGIHNCVAVRAASIIKRLGLVPPVYMTGGVAQNRGVVRALQEQLGVSITVSPLAQFNGAYGAAIYGYKQVLKQQESE